MTSKIVVNNIEADAGVSTVTFNSNVERGTSNLHSVGIEVANINTLGGSVKFGGDVGIAGTLTYEDVTNIDSVGVITARDGIRCTGIVTATAFHGDGSALTGTGVQGSTSVNTTGIGTFSAIVSDTALSHRNRIINGAMQVWQRGTTFASQGNGQNDYTADRWAIGHNNSHMAAVTQATGPANDFLYCARVQRDSGNSQTDQMRFHTALETKDVRSLRNKILTISYYARKGANYSEANSKITGVRIATGENTDGDPNAYSGGHWTNSTTILTGTPTLTTSWQRFTHTTSAVSTSANSMIIEFRHTPVGTAGANDYYEITGVQLEIGSVATPFEHRTFQEEMLRCQRYFWKHPGTLYGGAYGGAGFCIASLPVTMRTTGAVTYTAIRTSSGYYDYSTPKSLQIYMNATNPYISNPELDSEL